MIFVMRGKGKWKSYQLHITLPNGLLIYLKIPFSFYNNCVKSLYLKINNCDPMDKIGFFFLKKRGVPTGGGHEWKRWGEA